ncbi:MAG: RecX family transcriptional regulator [Patescibacteria group bacterium]
MPRKSAFEYALKLLGYRAKTEKELRLKLVEKKYQPEEIEVVLVKLAKIGLIDDQKFAVNYAQDKLSINRRGPRRIYIELIQRGVAKEIADQVTRTINKEDELEVAQTLLNTRIRQWNKLDPLAKKRRAVGLLSRRGFSPQTIHQLIFNRAEE